MKQIKIVKKNTGPYLLIKILNEDYNMEKRVMGSNFIFPVIFRLSGRISSGEKVEGGRNFGEGWGLGRISSCRELDTPLKYNKILGAVYDDFPNPSS